MNRQELITLISQKKSFLCIGLDTDVSKIPAHLRETDDPAFEFNKAIIDATHDLAMVEELCPRMIVMDGGRIVFDGSTPQTLQNQALLQAHGLAG